MNYDNSLVSYYVLFGRNTIRHALSVVIIVISSFSLQSCTLLRKQQVI